jgi:hypothetical protein
MVRFDDLIGKKVILALMNSEAASYDVVLHGVEHGGIWVESPDLERLFGHQRGNATKLKLLKKPVFFYPYSQISLVISYSTEL